MTDSKRHVTFAISGTREEADEKIVKLCKLIEQLEQPAWPQLEDKPAKPARPAVVRMWDIDVPVVTPKYAFFATLYASIMGSGLALLIWHPLPAVAAIATGAFFWLMYGMTNFIAREAQRDQEVYLQQWAEAEARDAGAHNPHELR